MVRPNCVGPFGSYTGNPKVQCKEIKPDREDHQSRHSIKEDKTGVEGGPHSPGY